MKEITAVIRMNMMNRTKQALVNVGVSSFTAAKVLGRGKGQVDYYLLKGAEKGIEEAIVQLDNKPRLVAKRLITVVVPDSKVQPVIEAIIGTNQTGNPGDGKIWVMPVSEAIRVRTGETGDEAVNEIAR